MKLHTLAKSLCEMMGIPPDKHLTFEDKLGLLVDQEWTSRENRRISRRVQEAKLSVRAREWLSRSMIAVEAPGWRGATKAHTAGM